MSTLHITTARLLLRDLEIDDAERMFCMDSDPLLCALTGEIAPQDISETISHIGHIRMQYAENGFGRYAIVERASGHFIGWAGLKLEKNVNNHDKFIDLGYRLLSQYWNHGYATEAAIALVSYGFEVLHADKICAYIESCNPASRKIAEKAGLKVVSTFNGDRMEEWWLEIQSSDYNASMKPTDVMFM